MLFRSGGENRETKIFQRAAVYGFGRYCGRPSLKQGRNRDNCSFSHPHPQYDDDLNTISLYDF